MDSPSTGYVADLLQRVIMKGARLWVDNGSLRYKAPRNALTNEEIGSLRRSRNEIVALLEDAVLTGDANSRSNAKLNCSPLTFSQIQHWNFYHLDERPGVRHLASAARLEGRLNLDAFQRSVAEVVRRHDALRTRIVKLGETPMQEIAPLNDWSLSVQDLSNVKRSSVEAEVKRRIRDTILQPVHVSTDPLFAVRLFRVDENNHVFLIAMEHIISDMWSLDVFVRDVFAAYACAATDRTFDLPDVAVQFPDFAAWQRHQERLWIENHDAYWNTRLAGCGRQRLPADVLSRGEPLTWGMVPIPVEMDLCRRLRTWCQQQQTTVVLGVFAAYAAIVMRWCQVSDTVIRFESNGRENQKVENTIGYFTCPLYLRIILCPGDTFVDLLRRVTEEYCHASEHADYSRIEAKLPRPEFSRNTSFNWVPHHSSSKSVVLEGTEHALARSAFSFDNPFLTHAERDTEPFALFGEDAMHTLAPKGGSDCEPVASSTDACDRPIVGGVYFPQNRFSVDLMERFARDFVVTIETLLAQPERSIETMPIARLGG